MGVTVTVPTLGGVVPELAVQVKGPTPLAVSTELWPKQIADTDGVILIVGVVVTETVVTADDVQVPTPDTTV